jgi:hypothetical protein
MRNPSEIAEFLEQRIAQIYERPLMYGGTAHAVDLLLHYWHEIWAVVHCREDDYRKMEHGIHEAEGHLGCNFAAHYRRNNPKASDQETARYVVTQWKKISSRLGLPFHGQQSK